MAFKVPGQKWFHRSQKRFQFCFVRNPANTSEPCVIRQNESPGQSSGILMANELSYMKLRLANTPGAPRFPVERPLKRATKV